VPAHFALGQVSLSAFEFGKAEASFARALELDPRFTRARRQWERSVKIRMASPGTVVGKKVALAEPLTRADLAALIATELGLEAKLRQHRPEAFDPSYHAPAGIRMAADNGAAPLTDIDGHWARNSIELVTSLGVLEPFPDRTFRPDTPVSRAALAVVLQNVLIVATGDEKLSTQFVGATSPFPDVRNDHFAFNAVLLATTRGMMEADGKSGAFRLADPVSGADALLSIRKLAELF
jgi:S-layer family protein